MNNEILLPNRCHNFAKSGLLRLYSRGSASAKSFPLYNHNVKCERIYTTDRVAAGNASAERNVIVEDCHEEKDLQTLFEKYPEAKKIKEAAGAR